MGVPRGPLRVLRGGSARNDQSGGNDFRSATRAFLAADAQVPADGNGFRSFTLAHNLRSPEEVDEVFAQALQAGAAAVKPPQKVIWGGYSGYFADPDGFLWEVAYNPFFWIE